MLAACCDAGQPVVPMDGLTGLVRSATAGAGEIGLMRRLKQTLGPRGILNPGRVL